MLLKALDELLEHKHPENVSLREVARHAGVSHGLPGYYFQDRRGMLTAYATEGYRILAEMIAMAYSRVADQPAATKLAEIGIAYVDFAERFRRRFSVMYHTNDINLENREFIEHSERTFAMLHSCVVEYFPESPDREQRAWPIIFGAWSLVHGAVMLRQGTRLKARFSEEQMRPMVRKMCYDFATSNLPPDGPQSAA